MYFLKNILGTTLLFFALTSVAHAAVLKAEPDFRTRSIGETANIRIVIDTEQESINAAQATVLFPADILEIVEADISNSVFNFWAEGPTISNEDGTVSFIGGTQRGISGGALHVLTLVAKTRGAGEAEVSLSNAVVTASDGKGTNVLSTIEGTSISVGTEVIAPTPAPKPAEATPAPGALPEVITRAPTRATGLPAKPNVSIALYPDPERWYNHTGDAIALWKVLEDVSAVATKLDKNPNAEPLDVAEQLTTGKEFGVLEEGVWYAHIQFKNNVGWGPIAHYRIAIDTTPPRAFEISVDGAGSDNPSPTLSFETFDTLSGISHAIVFVDGTEVATTTEANMTLPPQEPGEHEAVVRIFDKAGNSVEAVVAFEILPLPTPSIIFLSERVESAATGFVSGTSLPVTFVDVTIWTRDGNSALSESVPVDGRGAWRLTFGDELKTGSYTLTAIARDERGAKSFATDKREFRVHPPIVLSFGFIELGWFEIALIVTLMVLAGAGLAGWWYMKEQEMRGAYRTVAVRDVQKMAVLMEEELNALTKWHDKEANKFDPQAREESKFHIDRARVTVAKMKKYLTEEFKKVR